MATNVASRGVVTSAAPALASAGFNVSVGTVSNEIDSVVTNQSETRRINRFL